MDEDVTKLALECLKVDLERLRLEAESSRVNAEGFRELIAALSPILLAIVKLVESGGEFSSETFKEFTEKLPGFVAKLPTLNDFIKFATTISDDALESLIDDLQKMLDDREEK